MRAAWNIAVTAFGVQVRFLTIAPLTVPANATVKCSTWAPRGLPEQARRIRTIVFTSLLRNPRWPQKKRASLFESRRQTATNTSNVRTKHNTPRPRSTLPTQRIHGLPRKNNFCFHNRNLGRATSSSSRLWSAAYVANDAQEPRLTYSLIVLGWHPSIVYTYDWKEEGRNDTKYKVSIGKEKVCLQ